MYQKKINVAVIGATGYVGLDLTLLLSRHPKVIVKYLCAQKNIGKKIQYFDKRIKKILPKICRSSQIEWGSIDLVYLSLPNGEAQKFIKKHIKKKNIKFIDLSADFRINNPNIYKKWYGIEHKAKKLIQKSLYSVSEFVKNDIKSFKIISNPGCYPTSIQIPLIPLIKKRLIKLNNIIIDSKSGYSGAGKNFERKFKHKNILTSIYSYKVNGHRHMSELNQEFKKNSSAKIKYSFNPHLIPTFRGLISSIYLELNNTSISKVHYELKRFHKKNKFVKILKLNSELGTGNVLNTNKCEISVCESNINNRIVIFSAIDNLIKGASGQAVQNMNLSFGFNESSGLI